MKKRKKQAGMAVVAVSVITAGAVSASAAYQNGLNFEPKDSNRKLQNNQVVFADDQDQVERTQDDSGDNSEIWEKNQNNDQNSDSGEKNQSDYLFQQNSQTSHTQAVTVSASDNTGGNAGQNTGTQDGAATAGDGSYNLTDDVSNADLVINGTGNGQATNPEQPGIGDGNGTEIDENDRNNTNGNGDSSDSDSKPSTDDKNDSDNNNGGTNTKRPSATAKDPVIKKDNPMNDGILNNPFPDTGVSDITTDDNGDSRNVIIMPKWGMDVTSLYKGQTIDQTMIYNSLDTYVYADDGTSRYVWGEGALNEFVRIDAVSFDGGVTWKNDFPVTIPTTVDEDTMLIKASYRLAKDKDWVERQVSYTLSANRIFVLSREIEEENTVIDEDTILNYDQNPEVGSLVNLFGVQQRYLGNEPLTELFPGWTEDGELVPWLYPATEGRHILEPAKSVPLSSKYTVQLKYFWMTDDYQVDFLNGNNLAYLQTLTGFADKAVVRMKDGTIFDRIRYDELIVPEYVQAVAIDSAEEIDVDYLKIPETVLYLADSSTGLHVNRGYLVDEDNPMYQSTDDGVLLDKEATQILGIPYELEKLTIPASITNVKLDEDNSISEIELEAESLDTIPELSYSNINNCKIIVPDSYIEAYLIENNALIRQGTGNTVASADDPDITYTMKSGVMLSSNGEVRRIVSENNTSVTLPGAAKQIEKDAFSKGAGIETLILPKNGNKLHLEAGSLKDSNVTTILCYSQAQYDTIKAELGDSGTDKDISVELLQKSAEGYYYSVSDEGVVLFDVPEDTTSFDGTMTAVDGTPIEISKIAEHAFSECKNLEWVTLPECVKKIGYKAFEDCTKLQGIMINSTDSITIGNGAFDGCDSLRFVASNAMEGIMEDGYAPQIKDSYYQSSGLTYFYIPTNYTGYFDGCTSFTEASGVASYGLVEIGGDARMLYGLDEMGTPWIGLRAGGNVADEVTLPESTTELFSYSLADTKSPSGSYSVNWDDLWMLNWLDSGAFRNSDLGGEITLGDYYFLYESAFAGCRSITELTMGDNIYLAADVFQNCSGLTKVTLGSFFNDSAVYYGVFTGCDSLRDVYFTSQTAPRLMVYGTVKYQFNYNWTEEEELENLRIHVPEGSEKNYVRDWRYVFAGYIDTPDQSAHDRMWEDIRMDHMDWDTWEFPSDEEVDAYVEEALVEAENRVRNMLGIETVEKPSEWYEYSVDEYGIITLTSVPSDCTEITLDAETLGLPEGWYLDNIGSEAFSKAKNLQKVIIPNGLAAIYSNAFAGVESEDVTLVFEGWAPDLFRSDDDILNGVPFSFGIDDSHLHIQVPEGWEDFYIEMWQYIFAGYDTAEDMWNAIEVELTEQNGTEPEISEILDEMDKRLNVSQNRIRAMMGLEPVDNDSTNTPDNSGDDDIWDTPDDSGDDDIWDIPWDDIWGDDDIWDIPWDDDDSADTPDDSGDDDIWDTPWDDIWGDDIWDTPWDDIWNTPFSIRNVKVSDAAVQKTEKNTSDKVNVSENKNKKNAVNIAGADVDKKDTDETVPEEEDTQE